METGTVLLTVPLEGEGVPVTDASESTTTTTGSTGHTGQSLLLDGGEPSVFHRVHGPFVVGDILLLLRKTGSVERRRVTSWSRSTSHSLSGILPDPG